VRKIDRENNGKADRETGRQTENVFAIHRIIYNEIKTDRKTQRKTNGWM